MQFGTIMPDRTRNTRIEYRLLEDKENIDCYFLPKIDTKNFLETGNI